MFFCVPGLGSVDPQAAPEKQLEDMMRLGELVIEVLQQNDEHHSEVGRGRR